MRGGGKKIKPLALYVHIPFCVRKCDYCDFLSAPASEDEKESYVNLLCGEIERAADRFRGYRAETVFFGGGTPTALRTDQLVQILCKLKERFLIVEDGKTKEPEITLECNPGTVGGDNLKRLRQAGFNRLSIGLQSAQNAELKRLGRIHRWEDFLEIFRLAREAGFRNINVDLMSALPGQTTESYLDTLERVTALHPEHISAYSLIIEEGTLFFERYAETDRQRAREGEDREHLLPTEDEERLMYGLTQEILGENGYHRYEISNYALPGRECRHNITYWRRGDYLGLGLGAASMVDNRRFSNSRDMGEYRRWLQGCERKGTEEETAENTGNREKGEDLRRLSIQEQMEEFMFLGLRLTEGITCRDFEDTFHVPIDDIYGEILERLKGQGLLVRSDGRIFLTKRGIDVSNVVLADFLLS